MSLSLFFSIIREGKGLDKAIAIHNPFGRAVDLSHVSITKTTDRVVNFPLEKYNTIGPNESLILCYGDWADSKDSKGCTDFEYEITAFDGDEILQLYVGEELVDYVGLSASDWHLNELPEVCGIAGATRGKQLTRKIGTCSGNTEACGSFGTDKDDCEWTVHEVPHLDHSNSILDYNCSPRKRIVVHPIKEDPPTVQEPAPAQALEMEGVATIALRNGALCSVGALWGESNKGLSGGKVKSHSTKISLNGREEVADQLPHSITSTDSFSSWEEGNNGHKIVGLVENGSYNKKSEFDRNGNEIPREQGTFARYTFCVQGEAEYYRVEESTA